ncbi:kinesin-related protein 4-like isoform X2 [Pararge aegeria]|uniref:kinesin-related protein 4-like isoform X2 n=1 Tax=Pararge aegeria TaxID=116150 RepID=UPI0019D2DF69|nr:kinesin-related protein 4-like isoform X2 [Pararge aegeria]
MSDNIKVVVKVRPLIRRELEDKLLLQWRVNNNALIQIDQNGRECGPVFTFDKVYDETTKTSNVYNDIAKPIVAAATAGFNGTIFAYGQTSSGKTYTMTGTDDAPGIIPLAVLNLYDIIKNVPDRDFLVRVSYVEIYNETLIDLLNLEKRIKIHETFGQGVKVDATEKVTTSPEEVLQVMREGKANRQTGSTNMNDESSRSHSIFQITIESREHIEGEQEVGSVNVSQLNLVDLAGSERAGQTGATGLRFKEGTHINKSLSVLALVIKQLSEDPNKHANYRDSKLTRILQNSLGGNAKTSIICAVTPAALEETISTLQFANRAKSIKNTPAVNAVATNATMIQSLTKQLSALKTELECKKNVEQDNFNLQKRIGGLQRLILNGFAQRSTTDIIGGARRKLQNPRRVTISTLHPIQEDSVPTVPRFCTPSLKYNPVSLNTLPEFLPIQSASQNLQSVTEDRLITPPPYNRKVTISDEVIELDSDDDTSVDVQTCSPYHGCYESSKTPPCILRKNAKQAEKNLKDIVELTEREKIYTPNVVELMEKLENKSLKISNLKENINELNDLSMEKDKEMERLKRKISEAEEEIKNIASAKSNLETTCKNYTTKLTDWEVSYETLQKKAKQREEELLSLLKENELKKKHEKIGKISSNALGKELTHFMDLSRDLSLVNSDNENSIINAEETVLHPGFRMINDSDSKLCLKDHTIFQLEADLHAQNLKIDSLENMNKKFQIIISDFEEKISYLENENSLQKSTIDNLNRTIASQQLANETAKADIESYNTVINELKVQLYNKVDKSNHINDSDFESIIANEELFIANNENMKNITQSLKRALEIRDEEIRNLKSSLDEETPLDFKYLEEELKRKKTEISSLLKEIESLKESNIAELNNFIQTKNSFLSVEQQLKTQLSELQIVKDKDTKEHLGEIANLKTCKENLTFELIKKQQEKETLQSKVDNLSKEILTLKKEMRTKDNIIAELRNVEQASQENLARVSLQLHNLIVLLSGKILEVPIMIDSLVSAFETLTENITSLEMIAIDIVKEKNDLRALIEHHQNTFIKLKSKINDLGNAVDVLCNDSQCFNNMILEDNVCDNSETNKNIHEGSYQDIELKMENLMDKLRTALEYLSNNLQNKELEINNVKLEFESKLTSETTKHLQEIEDIKNQRMLVLRNLLGKVTIMASQLDIENSSLNETENDIENRTYEQIILIFDKIVNYILLFKAQKTTECDNIKEILTEAKNEIHKLKKENQNLVKDISNLEKCNKEVLTAEIKNIQTDGKIISVNLNQSDIILKELRSDLISKTSEIEIIENKAKEWKDKFREHELVMKDQIKMLELENTELKIKYSELEMLYANSPLSKTDLASGDQKCISKQSLESPPSLLTICCNKLIKCVSNENASLESSSSNSTDLKFICQCPELSADLSLLQEENINLKIRIEQLEITNNFLVKEQKEVQEEVQLLVENTQELQKKVVNHRTNMSTLTATTYAENKSLTSQIKFLQHHQNRFHNVCLKDIPALKSQLQDLMILLKSENKHKQNESFNRYSLPNILDITSKFKNESILDGDLLMLDTNVTLTTCNNTLVGHDHTCLDVTQVSTYNDVACQTSLIDITNYDLLHSQMETPPYDYIKILDTLESLKVDNNKLRNLVDEYSKNKNSNVYVTDTISSLIKVQNTCESDLNLNYTEPIDSLCNCNHKENMRTMVEKHQKEIDTVTKKLEELELKKKDIEQKYQDLTLEVPSIDLLVQKLSVLEAESHSKQSEITKILQTLKNKNGELRNLQEENNILSSQVFESISELDDLKKEQDSLKELNSKLTDNCLLLGKQIEDLKNKSEKEITCEECRLKSEVIISLENRLAIESHIQLERSYSDSVSSSRCNKICSLQNELHAGKEDCIELKEEVTTIKNHLDRSNLNISHAMDLDDNIENSPMFSYDDFELNSQGIKCVIPNVPGESLEILISDKEKCLSYYAEKTETDKENIGCDIKLIDVMKMLYDYLETKHAHEVQNLVNKLKDFEDSKNALQIMIDDIKTQKLRIAKELEEKDSYLQTLANVVSHVSNNIAGLSVENDVQDILIRFKDNFLKVIHKEFGICGTEVFEYAMQQLHQNHTAEMERLRNDNVKLEDDTQEIVKKLHIANESCSTLKLQLNEKEIEFNMLQRQNEKINELNASVTLDIVKMEQDLRKQIINGFSELIDKNIINEEIDLTLPTYKLVELLFKLALNIISNNELLQEEKNNITAEIDTLKTLLDFKDAALNKMTGELADIKEIKSNIQLDLSQKEKELNTQFSRFEILNTVHIKKVEENDCNARLISQLTEEVNKLKATLLNKENLVRSLESKIEEYNENNLVENEFKVSELVKSISELQEEIKHLKTINEIVINEKESNSSELEKAFAVIKQNKIDLDKMTKDIFELRETAKESSTATDTLKAKFVTLNQTKDTLIAMNKELEEQIQEKAQNCSRLEMNIKTHEKTAEIQSRMINRLQRQKEEDDKLACEKELKLQELTQRCISLEAECVKLTNDMKSSIDEVEKLRKGKLSLEIRISDLEEEVQNSKRRTSLEATAETTRRRRQSIHDSKRMFADDNEEPAQLKSYTITEDVFMDVDGDSSSRSTPVLMHKGRDSLLLKNDQSDKEEDQSRSSSVLASRRRRQSVHDLHRSVRLTPEPRENSRDSSRNNSVDCEVTQLRKQLTCCQKELEELKEKYRELDEECEICAEYLRERDEQCLKLKKEKRELENTLAELTDKLKYNNPNGSQVSKNSFAHASVNTDEDWANLHSVVVDRMSYDAEVEKNKKLMKTIEELRFRKQDMKNTMSKMQKALDKHSGKDKELEATRASLAECKHELSELRKRFKELDEECETCAAYLRERDDQCRALKEAKAALEAKLLDYTEEDGVAASLRKKRQALHDKRRVPPVESADAATDTSDDLLTYKVDNSKLGSDDKQAAELKRLKMALEKVSQQKNELEHQLSAAPQQGREDTIMKKNEDIEDLSLCNAEAKLQGSDNGYLERENVDLKTKYEHLKKKTLLREKELLSRIQEYAGAHKQACSSSEVSNGQKGENNKSIEPTIHATEEPDPITVPPKIDQSLKKFTIKNKESSEIKSTHKTKIVDQMIMEQAERRCMEVSHGPEVNAPAPENIKQITRKKRQQLHDLRRDIENGLGIPKFVISRHYHYHHYHYHHFL